MLQQFASADEDARERLLTELSGETTGASRERKRSRRDSSLERDVAEGNSISTFEFSGVTSAGPSRQRDPVWTPMSWQPPSQEFEPADPRNPIQPNAASMSGQLLPDAPSMYGLDTALDSTPTAGRPRITYKAAVDELVTAVCGSVTVDTPNEIFLKTYFTWQAPQLLPIDEAAFRRDMALTPRGPCCSPLLLQTLHSQASRHMAPTLPSSNYVDQADALLVPALSSPPTIPTIQALLIQAGRDLALGQASQGWLKSGMAIRMLTDLGLDRDVTIDEHAVNVANRQDLILRKRLFWSAYCWDKFFALTMGRQPSLSLPRIVHGEIEPPTFHSSDLWSPFYPDSVQASYAPQPACIGETFYASCLLYQEIASIMQHLYITGREASLDDDLIFVHDMSARLLKWRKKVASQVLLDTAYLPNDSPPPHILTMNILYRTAWILLHRPMASNKSSLADSLAAQQSCASKSAEINLLFALHSKTFGLRNITYLMAYMAYVSATIDITEALCSDPVRRTLAASRLDLTLRVLTEAVKHTPGIQRSIHYLRQKLLRQPDRASTNNPSGTATPTTAHPAGNAGASITEAQVQLALDNSTVPQSQSQLNTVLGGGLGGFDNLAGPFSGMSLGAGFDELFASLLPEYSTDTTSLWQPDLFDNSTAYLPMSDLDWLTDLQQ